MAIQIDLHVSHVSHTLTELQDEDLVELLIPEDRRKEHFYGLTDAGEAIATKVDR